MTKWRVVVGVALMVAVGGWLAVGLVVAVGRWLAVLWSLHSPQDLLEHWCWGCLIVGAVLIVGGGRAAGAALIGSSVLSGIAAVTSRLYGGDHLETLVHGAVILGSVGMVAFGLTGLALGSHAPLGRFPGALALAFGTLIGGALLILRIKEEAAPSCSLRTGLRVAFGASCFRGFEDPWIQALLGFDVAFLALLFLVQARHPTRPWGIIGPATPWDVDGSALQREGKSTTGPF